MTQYLVHYGVKGMKWGKHVMASPEERMYDVTDKKTGLKFTAYKIYSDAKNTAERYPSIAKSGKGNASNFSKWSKQTFRNLSEDAVRDRAEKLNIKRSERGKKRSLAKAAVNAYKRKVAQSKLPKYANHANNSYNVNRGKSKVSKLLRSYKFLPEEI